MHLGYARDGSTRIGARAQGRFHLHGLVHIAGELPGQEIEYPMAIVILGGLVVATLLNLFIVPSLYLQFGKRKRDREAAEAAEAELLEGYAGDEAFERAAIVDRLTFGGNIIETGTALYRLAQTLAQRTS